MSTEQDDTRPLPRTDGGRSDDPTLAIETSGRSTSTGPVRQERPATTSMRVGTVVWGLVLAIVGVGVIALAAGARVDLELAVIVLLTLAGVGLVAGSVATAARQRRREGRAPASS